MMLKAIWIAAMAVVGMAVVGLILAGGYGGNAGAAKREDLTLELSLEEDDDVPTEDQTRDTRAEVDSAPSRALLTGPGSNDGTNGESAGAPTNATGGTVSRRDRSVDTAPTSGVTRGTVSGGPGTLDTAPTSRVTRGTVSGGAGTHDGGGGGGTGSGGGTTS